MHTTRDTDEIMSSLDTVYYICYAKSLIQGCTKQMYNKLFHQQVRVLHRTIAHKKLPQSPLDRLLTETPVRAIE